jgi:meso-butanediol dehydrogenase/(S,S)-butanediol dehydrogenase/diacetyl reductase
MLWSGERFERDMTSNRYDFQDRTVLVTGGGSGIGRAIARAFLDNGANVVVSGRTQDKLDETLQEYDADHGLAVVADVGQDQDAARMVAAAVDRFGSLNVVVNNAAAYANGAFDEMSLEDWQDIRTSNIDGFVHVPGTRSPSWRSRAGTSWSWAPSPGCAVTGDRRRTTRPKRRS